MSQCFTSPNSWGYLWICYVQQILVEVMWNIVKQIPNYRDFNPKPWTPPLGHLHLSPICPWLGSALADVRWLRRLRRRGFPAGWKDGMRRWKKSRTSWEVVNIPLWTSRVSTIQVAQDFATIHGMSVLLDHHPRMEHNNHPLGDAGLRNHPFGSKMVEQEWQ